MLDQLAPGDVVTVTRIDRLGRSTFDLFAIVKAHRGLQRPQFRSLAEPWADTGTSTGRLMLAVLGGLADVERDLIRTCTARRQEPRLLGGKHTPLPSHRPNIKRPPDGAQGDVAGVGGQLRPQHFHHAPRDETRMSGIERIQIQTYLGVPNTDKTGRRMTGTPSITQRSSHPICHRP